MTLSVVAGVDEVLAGNGIDIIEPAAIFLPGRWLYLPAVGPAAESHRKLALGIYPRRDHVGHRWYCSHLDERDLRGNLASRIDWWRTVYGSRANRELQKA